MKKGIVRAPAAAIKTLVACRREGLSLQESCRRAGLNYSTFKNWQRSQKAGHQSPQSIIANAVDHAWAEHIANESASLIKSLYDV